MTDEYLGCGDNSCIFEVPKGMGTNGGCRCFKDIDDRVVALRVRRAVVRLKAERDAALKPKPWQHCDIHTDIDPQHHWACADCMAEARHLLREADWFIDQINADTYFVPNWPEWHKKVKAALNGTV